MATADWQEEVDALKSEINSTRAHLEYLDSRLIEMLHDWYYVDENGTEIQM